MKRIILYLLLLIPVGELAAQTLTESSVLSHKLNIGIKAGFASSMTFTEKFTIGDYHLDKIQNNYKLGYFVSIFNRFNLKGHHIIQPEFNYTVTQGSMSVVRNNELRDIIADNILIRTHLSTIDFMPLYGYKFIDRNIYGMALFIGPKISWVLNQQSTMDIKGMYQQGIQSQFEPFNFGFEMGLAVNISKIFFDFRYDAGLSHLIKDIKFDNMQTKDPYKNQPIELQRRRDILSFSFGIML